MAPASPHPRPVSMIMLSSRGRVVAPVPRHRLEDDQAAGPISTPARRSCARRALCIEPQKRQRLAEGLHPVRFSLFKPDPPELRCQPGWPEQWRSPEPKPAYDAVIIGGGGHGLATAYYMAAEHGLRNIAVVEKGWLGGGNTGRNTTIIRSNYLWDGERGALQPRAQPVAGSQPRPQLQCDVLPARLHDAGAQHPRRAGVQAPRARQPAAGIDNEWLSAEQAKAFCPILNISPDLRYPIIGASLQRRGGVARHDAVAWGYARAASALGVDILQKCEVTAIRRDASGAVSGIETTRGPIATKRIGVVAAGKHFHRHEHGRRAIAARKLSAPGARLRADQADHAPAS